MVVGVSPVSVVQRRHTHLIPRKPVVTPAPVVPGSLVDLGIGHPIPSTSIHPLLLVLVVLHSFGFPCSDPQGSPPPWQPITLPSSVSESAPMSARICDR